MKRGCWMAAAILTAGMCAAISVAAQTHTLHEKRLEIGSSPYIVTTGTLRVPELRNDATDGSNTVEVAFTRVRQSEIPTRSAHVLLAGGPGDSGVDQVLQLVQRGGPEVQALFDGDIIGIDQRGTGRSLPSLAAKINYDLPLDQPASMDSWLPVMRQAASTVAADFRARGIRLEAYNTRESAEDVEQLRRALGYSALTLWGRSYGTHLALAVLRQHPASVERMILVAPEGPDDTWKLPSQVDEVLERLGQRAGQPDLTQRMRKVIDALASRPVTVTFPDPATKAPVSLTLGAFDVQWVTAQVLDDPRALATLPAAYQRMAEGDFSAFAPLALMARRRAGIDSAMKPMMDLSSGASPMRREQIDREARNAVLGNSINFSDMYLAGAWGASDLGDAFRAPVVSQIPALILVGDLDARTPVSNGRKIVATLPNAHLVVLENAAHKFDLFGSPVLRAVLGDSLRGNSIRQDKIVLTPLTFQK